MMRISLMMLVVAVGWMSAPAFGQVPYYMAGTTIATPQISYATTGAELNVDRAVVSPDRKYVTLDLNPQFDQLQGFTSFTYQTGSGFVGTATTPATGTTGAAASGAARNSRAQTPAAQPPAAAPTASASTNILDRPGMVLIAPLPASK